MKRLQRCLVGLVGTAVLATWGCSSPDAETQEGELKTSKPHLLALSTYSASLGTPVDGFIANPPKENVQKIELVFDGTFKRRDGKVETVKITEPTVRPEGGTIRWTTFGPFANPFTKDNPDIGVFTGKVGVKVTKNDNTEEMDEAPIPVTFEVKPSIIVTELQPVGAECDAPAIRLIGGLRYKLKTEVIGIDATSVDYEMKVPSMALDAQGGATLARDEKSGTPKYRATLVAHAVGDTSKNGKTTDAVEEKDAFLLPNVPGEEPSYGVIFSIIAKDAKGETVKSLFGMRAHNPLTVYPADEFTIAEFYAPQPVSSCISGGQTGRNVSYDESIADTQTRTVSVTLMTNWLATEENNWSTSDGKTFGRSKATTDGTSKTRSSSNSITMEENSSENFNWSFRKEGNGSVGIKGILHGGGSVAWDDSHGSTSGRSRSEHKETSESSTNDHSETTTDTEDVSKTDTKGGSKSDQIGGGKNEDTQWQVSSTQTISKGFNGTIQPNTYGMFYRQMVRYVKKHSVLQLDACGKGDVVGSVTLEDFGWAPDLAIGKECKLPSTLPVSNLPKAECIEKCEK